MRIVLVSEYPPDNVIHYGGIPYYMSRAIHDASDFFQYVQIPAYDWGLALRGGSSAREELKKRGAYLSEALSAIDADVVLCQGSGFSAIPYVETHMKKAIWHDATWHAILEMEFDEFRARHPFLYEWDSMVLEKCDLIAFAADWVRDQTIECYHTEPGKIHILPFGANIDKISLETATQIVKNREFKPCQLTFLGIDWRRKGLHLAYAVMDQLNRKGIDARLNVIGCNVPAVSLRRKIEHYLGYKPYSDIEKFQPRFIEDRHVNKIGFLRKSAPSQYALLSEILKKTHFLLHPAFFECFGIALVEANAFGVPVIATNNHGPKSIIKNDVNGRLYDRETYITEAAAFIERHMEHRDAYEVLALNAFHEYEERFTWQASVQKLKRLLKQAT